MASNDLQEQEQFHEIDRFWYLRREYSNDQRKFSDARQHSPVSCFYPNIPEAEGLCEELINLHDEVM
jgi:hypothetical protein